MRQGHQNKRGRGRSRKNSNPLSRNYESNGPDVKIRGSASHIAEKYASLARDAQSSGDPVSAENYWQHAEHYYRIIQAAEAQSKTQNPGTNNGAQKRGNGDGRRGHGPAQNANGAENRKDATSPESAAQPNAVGEKADAEGAKPARRNTRSSGASNGNAKAEASEAAEAAPKKSPRKSAAKPAEKDAPPEDVVS